jgi:periplasmic protein CpxP/Spy
MSMPISSTRHLAAVVIAALLAGALPFARVAGAAEAQLAQAAPAPAPASAPANAVEQRIKSLHDQLQITADQEPQWNAVAEAMRDSAKATGALIAARAKKAKSMTAIEDLHSYRAIAKAHLDGIEKLSAAFEKLYAAMPDGQKKNADAVFSRRPTRPTAQKSG